MIVLVGSETGNSRDIAELVVHRLRRGHNRAVLKDFGNATIPEITAAKDVVIVCSTTGNGALPRNTQPLWNLLLKKSLPHDTFAGIRIYSFGLGDSAYAKFNWAIRKIHARFLQLGASEGCARGEGDERNPDGYEASFDQWLNIAFPVKEGDIGPDTLLPPLNTVALTQERDTSEPKLNGTDATVLSNTRITSPNHFQDVRHISLGGLNNIAYDVGDVISIAPQNTNLEVKKILDCQQWNEIADCTLATDVNGNWVAPLTLRNYLKYHADLNGVPKRSFFAICAYFCTDERQRERMMELTVDVQDLWDYANRPRRSLLEVVEEFDSLKIPIEYLLDVFPLLRWREFSIASPPLKTNPDLCVAVVRYKTRLRHIRNGTVTRMLAAADCGASLTVRVMRQSLRLQPLPLQPIILIATGTGIAPIRSLVLSGLVDSNPKTLFFGCRYHDHDFLYHEEWAAIPNLRVVPAFSREGGGYVQQQIELHPELDVASALIFVCGSSGQMPRAVRAALIDVLVRQDYSKESAESLIASKERRRQYLEDTW